MANLRKPEQCECGSKSNYKLLHPERWICRDCDKVICSRPERIKNSPTCLQCNKTRNEIEFRKGKNICIECHSKYNKEYRQNNKDKIKNNMKEYWENKGKELGISPQEARWQSIRKTIQSSPESFLKQLASHCRKQSNLKKKSQNGGNHTNSPIDVCGIDYNYLKNLWDINNGSCAITRLPMTYEYGQPHTISVDRIDSDKGYIIGNVQLICQFVNLGKNKFSQDQIKEFFDLYKVWL